jgi:Receptor L domain
MHCRYALVVFNNQNLQEVWNAEYMSSNLTIANGAVFFHFNPKLCMSNIRQLLAGNQIRDAFNEIDISPTTNGDQVACKCFLFEVPCVCKGGCTRIVSFATLVAIY